MSTFISLVSRLWRSNWFAEEYVFLTQKNTIFFIKTLWRFEKQSRAVQPINKSKLFFPFQIANGVPYTKKWIRTTGALWIQLLSFWHKWIFCVSCETKKCYFLNLFFPALFSSVSNCEGDKACFAQRKNRDKCTQGALSQSEASLILFGRIVANNLPSVKINTSKTASPTNWHEENFDQFCPLTVTS